MLVIAYQGRIRQGLVIESCDAIRAQRSMHFVTCNNVELFYYYADNIPEFYISYIIVLQVISVPRNKRLNYNINSAALLDHYFTSCNA